MNLQKGVFHNLLLTSPLEGKEDCILLIETAHSRSGYFWTIPILEVNQYHPWRWFWVEEWRVSTLVQGVSKMKFDTKILCSNVVFFSKKVLHKILLFTVFLKFVPLIQPALLHSNSDKVITTDCVSINAKYRVSCIETSFLNGLWGVEGPIILLDYYS